MALTKVHSTVIAWTPVAQNAIDVSDEFDVSSSYNHAIIIQAAVNTTAPHMGTEFIIHATSQPSGNKDWGVYETDEIGVELIGTGKTENLTNNPLAAGAATLTMTDTDGFATVGEGALGIDEIPGWRFIKDSTLINSELAYQTDFTTNTHIVVANGMATNHVQNTPVWNVAMSKTVELPDWASRVRVVVRNSYDADGAAVDYRILGGKITGV